MTLKQRALAFARFFGGTALVVLGTAGVAFGVVQLLDFMQGLIGDIWGTLLAFGALVCLISGLVGAFADG